MTLQELLIELESARSAFTRTTTFALPDNPSDQGWSAEDIKKKMYEPDITNYDNIKTIVSLCVELDTAIGNLGNSISELQSNDDIQDADIETLKGDIETINTKIAELKTYVDNNDVGEVKETLLTGILTTTLTLKNLATLTSSVDFKELFYLKSETYSREEANSKFVGNETLESEYLKKSDALDQFLSDEEASETYLSKVDAGTTYQTITDAETKHAAQDLAILNAQNKADSAYALAQGKSSTHFFDSYAELKKALSEDDGTHYNKGDFVVDLSKGRTDYTIKKVNATKSGDYGYYELEEIETDLSNYQTIEDTSLETTHKTIPGAINENKANIELKQSKNDSSLGTTNKTIVGGINELKSNVSDLQAKDASIDTEIANLKTKDTSLENSISSLNTALNDKQGKTDVSLNTDSKTITGAINELKEDIQTNTDNINLIEDKIPTKVSQLTNDKNYIDKSVNNLENYKTTTEITTILGNYALKTDIPTDNAALTNGANYIKKDVNNLENYYLKSETDTKLDTKVSKSGDTMTGTLIAPIIQTGSDANNYFQSQKFRGQGDANTYYHAVDFGYGGHNQVDFYEYSGIYNFWRNTSSTATTNAAHRVASLQLGKLLERGNTLTYPGKSGTFALTSDLPTKVSEMTDATDYVKFTDFMSDTKAGVAYAIPTTDVANLANVYIKDGILYAKANPVPVLNVVKVATLPTVGETSTIYIVPETDPTSDNKYVEYMYVDSAWEELGRTKIDLSDYATIEYVDTQIQIVKDLFGNYYTSATIDTKLTAKLDDTEFTAANIVSTIGTNAVARAVADQNGNAIDATYALKTELEDYVDLTSAQTISGVKTFNAPTNVSGQEQATTTFKTANGGQIILGKEKNNAGTVIALDQVSGTRRLNFRASSVSGSMIWEQPESNSIIYFDVINVDFRKTTSITFENIKNAPFLGTNSSGKVISVSASDLVSKLGTTAVNRATSDASGNNIENTYAKKTELTSKLENTSTAIVNTLGDTAVNKATKAVQDENGNNIASTYQRSAFIVNGSVATGGTITFTNLVVSDLLRAINNNQRIVFIPSDTSLASVDLNAIKTSDTSYTLKGSFTANVSSKLTNYSCQITATSTTATGTYTSQTANDYTYTLPTASASVLGGVKVDGTTITITNGVIKVAQSGQQTIELLDAFPSI